MNNEQHERQLRLYELANSKEYQAIKQEFLKYIVKASTGSIPSERIQGMLNLLAIPENWILDYEKELEKRNRNSSN